MMARERVMLAGLGAVARAARAAGLGRPLNVVRDGYDRAFLALGRPPLRGRIEGLAFRGYLRHRSFLANGARRGTSYVGLFTQALQPGLTVVDGGAHLGAYTVLAARAVGPRGCVLAFEPDAYNFAALAFNVRQLAGGRARLSRRALAAASGQADFHVSRGTLGTSLFAREDTGAVEVVETTSLDDELAGHDLDGGLLVKLNVEGAEALALDGMRQTLGRAEDVVLFAEVHPSLLRAAGTDPAAFIGELERLGLYLSWIERSTGSLSVVDEHCIDAHGHVLAVRLSGAQSGARAEALRARPPRQRPIARAGRASRAS